MSGVLSKSLDEIIASKGSTKPKKNFKNKAGSKVGKNPQKPRPAVKKPVVKSVPKKTIAGPSSSKAVIYGLPKDIKQDAVREFFDHEVGGIAHVALTYNEKGQSKGIATIIFKTPGYAQKALDKYNGAPIDGGKNKLKIELIYDPTKKPLSTRIQPNSAKNNNNQQKKLTVKANKLNKAVAKAKKAKVNNPKKPKNPKKTLEELDQEMTDYFEKKD